MFQIRLSGIDSCASAVQAAVVLQRLAEEGLCACLIQGWDGMSSHCVFQFGRDQHTNILCLAKMENAHRLFPVSASDHHR